MEIFSLVALVALALAFLVEAYMIHNHDKTYEAWTGLVEEYIDGFLEVKSVVNKNASVQRQAMEVIEKHEELIRVMAVVVDLQSEILKVGGESLKERLKKEKIDDTVATLSFDKSDD